MKTSSTTTQYIFFLVSLATSATLISYKTLLSYNATQSRISELAFLPPVKKEFRGIKSHTSPREDMPHAFVAPKYKTDAKAKEEEEILELEEEDDKPKIVITPTQIETEKKITAKALAATERIRDFVPMTPPAHVLKESKKRQVQIDFAAVAKKWELPDGSIDLLKQIQSRTVGFDYNITTDILSLRHPLKTGGTSFSWMMLDAFGDRVVPGSGPSNWWQQGQFKDAITRHQNDKDDSYWKNMAVLYTHTFLRPTRGGRKNSFLEDLRVQVPAFREKRFRLMTIVRRPIDLAASSFYETQCRVGRFGNQRHLKGAECPVVNLTDVMYKYIEHATNKCEESNAWKKPKCQDLKAGNGEKYFKHCGSIDVLMDETDNVHNMPHKSLMGDFPRPPELGDDEEIGINLTPTYEDVSLYTLRDLGGLIDYNPVHKEDFVWFAITERFSESMCLFYYYFEVKPVPEKTSLMKPCRPIHLWTEKQKEKFISKEDYSYTVWRAANSIMDVRMEDMRLQIKDRLDAGEILEDMPFVGPGCYKEA